MVSIIVPAYNCLGTIRDCLDSIVAQSFCDWEAIIVDDGSTDGTSIVCDEYSKRDRRFRIIHKINGGPASARNAALDISQGEFVCFIDSDDYVDRSYVNNLVNHLTEDSDVVLSGAFLSVGGISTSLAYEDMHETGTSFEEIFVSNTIHTHPWAVLFKRDIIVRNRLHFIENMFIGEDACFLFSYLAVCDGVVVSSDTDYIYNSAAEGSLTKKRYPLEQEKVHFDNVSFAVDKLIVDKHIKSSVALSRLISIKAEYLVRILDSVYFVENLTIGQRIGIIRRMDLSILPVYPMSAGFRPCFLSHMLKWRCFHLYDFVRAVAKKLLRR